MRIILLTLIILLSVNSLSQEDSVKRTPRMYCKIIHHELEVDPLSVWFNKGFSFGQRLKYAYFPNIRHKFTAETNGTWFKDLDFHAANKEWTDVFPRINRTQIVYEHSRPFRICKPKRFSISSQSFRAGYHYFQHATGSDHSDYWIVDSTVWEGQRTIAGFRSHSILIGFALDFESVNFSNRKHPRSQHRISVDYLFSPLYYLDLYNSADPSNPNLRMVPSFLPVNRSGGQFAYSFKREFSRDFGFHVDVEALWVPFLKDYQPNYDYFVWRGSEKIIPLFINARAGLYWKF